jgi:acetylornithine deacetylase/succinyl-diaminopimelate desuccinylase-like protein
MVLTIAAGGVHAQTPSGVAALRAEPAVAAALEHARRSEAQTIEDQVRFCEIPAPPFDERARGEALRRAFVDAGLLNVRVDAAGNVLGERPGANPRPHLVVASHLDTVFAREVEVKVKREGGVLRGPGIGDNCRGLAVLVATVRALERAKVATEGSITFVANVGEEGLGDLRGVKALFGLPFRSELGGVPRPAAAPPPEIDRFLSIDGAGIHITNVSVGSHRYRVVFHGPGGHSFGSFGLANPINALGRAVARISEFQVPRTPRVTFNVGRIGGGTSVNSIPAEAWMEVDLRSSDQEALAAIDAKFQQAVDAAVADENRRWGGARTIWADKILVGDRPAGVTPMNSAIVEAAQAAAEVLGLPAGFGEGSTDANVPTSLGVPAITIGAGGRGADVHAITETFDPTDAWKGTQHALLVTVALAQP